jgi:hypothetical protein
MNTISLPFIDLDGTLSPLVISAMEQGATSARDPQNEDLIVLTFADADALKDFNSKLVKPKPSK